MSNLKDFAEASYSTDTNTSIPNGYTKDTHLSTPNHSVYHKDNHVVIAYRGTSNPNDVFTDIVFGAKNHRNSRFDESVKVANDVKSKYNGKNIETTGHSLGGGLSIHVAKKTGLKSTAYNPASNLYSIFENLPSNVSIHRNKNDIVSLGYAFNNKTKNYNKNLDAVESHKLKNIF